MQVDLSPLPDRAPWEASGEGQQVSLGGTGQHKATDSIKGKAKSEITLRKLQFQRGLLD